MDQCLHATPNHRHAKTASDHEMLNIIFIDAFGMIDKQAVEHNRVLSSESAVAAV